MLRLIAGFLWKPGYIQRHLKGKPSGPSLLPDCSKQILIEFVDLLILLICSRHGPTLVNPVPEEEGGNEQPLPFMCYLIGQHVLLSASAALGWKMLLSAKMGYRFHKHKSCGFIMHQRLRLFFRILAT